MANGLTLRQRQVLEIVARAIEGGLPPTNREICRALGVVSTNATADHLRALERKGCIEREKHRARAVRITDLGRRELTH